MGRCGCILSLYAARACADAGSPGLSISAC